jgi:hypothetical protein
VLSMSLHRAVPITLLSPLRSVATIDAAFALNAVARPSDLIVSRPVGSFALWPGDLLTILKMALSIGPRNSISFLPASQATGSLTFPPVGLSPGLNTPTFAGRARSLFTPLNAVASLYLTSRDPVSGPYATALPRIYATCGANSETALPASRQSIPMLILPIRLRTELL